MIAGITFLVLAGLFRWGAIASRRAHLVVFLPLTAATFMSTVWGALYVTGLATFTW